MEEDIAIAGQHSQTHRGTLKPGPALMGANICTEDFGRDIVPRGAVRGRSQ